ncbi:MAG: M48 family metalloprotease, partial [Planctomycetota bacterium]|jgi:Zn-dependent protease with chaperone function
VLLNHVVVVLWLGWLDVIRSLVGDLVLVDELLCLAPAVAALLAITWVHYPIDGRLRQAQLLRSIDDGRPIYPLPPRTAYVLFHARSGLLLLGLPLLLIIGSSEVVERVAPMVLADGRSPLVEDVATLVAAAGVFLASPLLARLVLTVRPLPEGEMRDELRGVCRRHRVRVRGILVWDTGGAMINAAVMGLVGPLRYVLITDALLDSMTRPQLVAVMAHEVAHVRRHHIPWLVLSLMAALAAAFLLVQLPLHAADRLGWLAPGADGFAPPVWADLLVLAVQLVAALAAFGWVSRRFERQADTFAVQHLSGLGEHEEGEEPDVDGAAVEAMRGALDRIARLNAINPRRSSWRHGSIEWRQDYLASIIGQPIGRLTIDRRVRSIKVVAGLVLLAAITVELVMTESQPAATPAGAVAGP